MMTDQLERLFVYGTLMPGHGNHRRIADHVRGVLPGTIQGILVDLGSFPALLRGDGRVNGVILDMDAEALRITDRVEGYHPEEGRSLYVREMVEVDLGDGETVNAWTYFFADPAGVADRPMVAAQESDDTLIFDWTSNDS